jgi:hypothetical protein
MTIYLYRKVSQPHQLLVPMEAKNRIPSKMKMMMNREMEMALTRMAAEVVMERTRTRGGLRMMWMAAILSVNTATRHILAIPLCILI